MDESELASDNESENVNTPLSKAQPFSEYEKTLLLQLITRYQTVIEDKKTDYGTNTRKQQIWNTICDKFSCENGVQKRTASQLKNWWLNSKKRAKKDVSTHRKRLFKTGGGTKTPNLKPETIQIMSLVPTQMKSLDNQFDSDANFDFVRQNEGVTNCGTVDDRSDTTSTSNVLFLPNTSDTVSHQEIQPSASNALLNNRMNVTPVITRKRDRDPRSGLVDMEFEEHQIRLKTLRVEYEDAVIRREISTEKKNFANMKHELELQILKKSLD